MADWRPQLQPNHKHKPGTALSHLSGTLLSFRRTGKYLTKIQAIRVVREHQGTNGLTLLTICSRGQSGSPQSNDMSDFIKHLDHLNLSLIFSYISPLLQYSAECATAVCSRVNWLPIARQPITRATAPGHGNP